MKQQGLFEIDSDPIGGTEISDACQRMFEDLEAKGLLGPIEQAKRAMVTKAAAALDRGLAQPKVSVATTTVLDKVLAALDSMPRPAEGGDPELDALDAALSHLTMQALATGNVGVVQNDL